MLYSNHLRCIDDLAAAFQAAKCRMARSASVSEFTLAHVD